MKNFKAERRIRTDLFDIELGGKFRQLVRFLRAFLSHSEQNLEFRDNMPASALVNLS
jgi:hypothetical protein